MVTSQLRTRGKRFLSIPASLDPPCNTPSISPARPSNRLKQQPGRSNRPCRNRARAPGCGRLPGPPGPRPAPGLSGALRTAKPDAIFAGVRTRLVRVPLRFFMSLALTRRPPAVWRGFLLDVVALVAEACQGVKKSEEATGPQLATTALTRTLTLKGRGTASATITATPI